VGPWKVKGDLIYLNDIIYIISNSPLTESILKEIRNSTHKGYYEGLQQVRVAFYWHRIKSQIKNIILSCDICRRHKADNVKQLGFCSYNQYLHRFGSTFQ
jgi:hypothetical protein